MKGFSGSGDRSQHITFTTELVSLIVIVSSVLRNMRRRDAARSDAPTLIIQLLYTQRRSAAPDSITLSLFGKRSSGSV